jgi:hypothetical protein
MKVMWKRLVPVALAAGALAFVGSAAAGGRTVQVSGVQTPVDPVAGRYLMTGDLNGWWYTTSISAIRFHPSGTAQLAGTELFDGCIDSDRDGVCEAGEPSGTLDFVFSFSGKFDDVTFAEIHGRCHHEITGGTGDFRTASGVLDFKDDPVTGCASYKGHIAL